ncbi:phospholipase D family protein [Dyella sp. 20L07]|uniref:phospholipase D family protein n=1 Tax=Dyella sp. 20L07 TaxID=3384240 RepID=UPI003D29B939
MELLTEDGSIAKRIRKIKPTHITTAYIGGDWAGYVDAKDIKSIVLSPTIGSSALAIWDLVKELGGFRKIHFLDTLHAKFYWSPEAAVLGSSNLSNNGLQGAGGLYEAAVAMNAKEHASQLADLRLMHERLVVHAKAQYPNEADKRAKLKWLTELQQRISLVDGFPAQGKPKSKKNKRGVSLQNFDPGLKRERIHIIGYDRPLRQSKEEVDEQLELENSRVKNHAFSHYMGINDGDDVVPGDWILAWRTRKDSWEPATNGWIGWIHVDFVVDGVSTDDESERVAREGRHMRDDEVPFVLDDTVKTAFRSLIVQKVGDGLCPDKWSLAQADKAVPKFLKALRAAVNG